MPSVKKLLALATAAAAVGAPAAGAATTTVKVLDDRFSRTTVVIKKGDTVRWVWRAKHRHNVFQVGGPGHFHSPTQAKGAYKHRFKKPGTYRFQCTYHTAMKMTVKVTR